MKVKYFLYARKSTEDEERQVMSIEAQLAELAQYAKRENLEVVEKFVESKSAKKPGREIFGEMIDKIKESKDPVGLLSWHPDRLARNSIDGGQIIYLIDQGKIASLRFPTFWFEPTPQGLFMLQVAFGQSKYYSDNLSENVKRGIRQKLRRGEYPGNAPFGYINNPKTRNIEPDPVKAKVVKKAFEEYATGKHTLESLGESLSFWGVVSKNGTPLCKATTQRMLTNQTYLGIIVWSGESYVGNYEPLVSRATFTAVQKVLKDRAKPRKTKEGHNFPFTGLLKCGECGAAITAQYAHGNGGTYKYYRCTKRLGPCGQSYLRAEDMAKQLKTRLQKVALCEDWTDRMLKKVEKWEKEKVQSSQSFAQNLEQEIEKTEEKLDRLVDALLEGTVEKETYLAKKNELIKDKIELQQKQEDFRRKGNNWIEPLKTWITDAHHAQKLASSDDLPEIKSFTEKIGTNRRLLSKTVRWDWVGAWQILAEIREEKELKNAENKNLADIKISENTKRLTWSRSADDNVIAFVKY